MLHPLLSRRVRSPLLTGTVFEAELGVDFPAFLNDHRIYETAIFPGAAYMEMGLAAVQQIFDGQKSSLADIVIREALVLPDEGEKTVQITVSAVESEKASFEIFSLSEGTNGSEESWKPHASGTILLEPAMDEKADAVDMEQLRTACPNPLNVSTFYQQLAELDIEYGPAFQGLSQIWQGDNEALGQVILSPDDAAESHKYQLHPALLDACFQLLGAATPPSMRKESDNVYVPVGLQALKVHQAGQSQVWAHVSFSSPITNDDGSPKDSLYGNIILFGQDGALIAEVIGLQLRQISRDAIRQMSQSRVEDWLYELNWQLSPKPAMDKSTTIKNWLIFADQNGIGDQLAEQLKTQGLAVTLIRPGDEYRQMNGNNWRLSPTRPDHFQQLLSDVSESLNGARLGIIHLWGLDNLFDVSNQKTDALLRNAQSLTCGSILHLVQALAEKSISPAGLWLITQGVHAIKPEDGLQGIVQASVWGLARTIVLEYPNWKCACVDIAQTPGNKLLEEILSQDDENQIALRGEERYVARLERSQIKANDLIVPDAPFELVIPSPGILDRLILQTTSRRPPEAGEVELRVKATGLNFRDVLNALGMYPGAKIPLGIECAGVVIALGDGVTEYKVGDEVIGLTTSAFRSFATMPVERVFSKPVNVSLTQSASIPITFLTASYGLHHLAGMKAGDRVLIHAAAGGVGLAAVQLAQRAGAEIFATGGSPEKRAYLKSLGVEHVFDSRNLNFASEIMQVTNGKGVNIVLNSLADEFIPKSLSVLADNGYFLEMGKRDDWDQAKVSQLNPTLKYHRYDLGTEMVNDMPFIRAMLNELLSDFGNEAFKPLPLRTFPMGSVREAFRYMAQARHIGKIIVTQEEETSLIREDGAYLITGGLGGLGLMTTRWLVERGARHLVLMGRSEPTEEIRETLAELQTGGAEIITAQGDVSCREDVERVLQQIEHKMPPLRGLFHEAGVLDDGVLSQQNWSRFERVMAPKGEGAWHLHTLTQNMPLDFFVLFSTAAAVLGSAGQGNYAAANSFLDGLAHYRKSRGLPAMSINWGAWSEVGMAAGLDSQGPKRRVSREADLIKPSDGMKVMGQLLS
ncbi:MAG: SDR family NAD(P)-dependent oxidoreductase, partial [Anaerolineales bacterium]